MEIAILVKSTSRNIERYIAVLQSELIPSNFAVKQLRVISILKYLSKKYVFNLTEQTVAIEKTIIKKLFQVSYLPESIEELIDILEIIELEHIWPENSQMMKLVNESIDTLSDYEIDNIDISNSQLLYAALFSKNQKNHSIDYNSKIVPWICDLFNFSKIKQISNKRLIGYLWLANNLIRLNKSLLSMLNDYNRLAITSLLSWAVQRRDIILFPLLARITMQLNKPECQNYSIISCASLFQGSNGAFGSNTDY